MLKIFLIKDEKTASFKKPNFCLHKQEIVRGVINAIKQGNNDYAEFPADFSVWEAGSFNQSSGKWEIFDTPVFVVNVGDLVMIAGKEIAGKD